MNGLLEGLSNMPGPAKAGAAAVFVGILGGMLYLFGGSSAIYVVLIGLVVIGLMLMGYTAVLKMLQQRQASPMERSIAGNAAAAPSGITAPARRARLDDLRKNFEGGVKKFRAAGKNLYALPWYLLVGEPGSGKTEAIRHCNIGFPPGLQDQLQGVGGTLNMNWWFTNYAIILDTAGRLMFEEVEPGTSSEWQEFLKLLRKNRPNCPVNGMLLVIPAESLIKDSSEAIETKGGKIAQQLDSIQRTLGVRFPVFVIITKCDLINGFREFFDELNDPALQHQILGWSNPDPLDTAFNPEQVEQHLRTVQERLQRRRMGLLLDPVNTEDARARRTDQVDAMYAFPDAMMKIAPRLRRYLETIFVAGEWSQKPLFLRGIYFTSSMREGSALDQELAEALGMPIENLPEGRIWERDRSYFLRDLFMQKVFREKGLVTRALHTSAQQKMRRNIVVGASAAGLLLIGGATYMGARALNDTIVSPSQFWQKVQSAYLDPRQGLASRGLMSEQYIPIVQRSTDADIDFKYHGNTEVGAVAVSGILETLGKIPDRAGGPFTPESQSGDKKEKSPTRTDVLVEISNQARAAITIPGVFRPVASLLGESSNNLAASERMDAARALFEGSVLRPLVDACKVNIDHDANENQWSPEATAALAQIIRLEVAALAENKNPELVELEPLMRYALRGNDDFNTKNVKDDLGRLDEVYRSLYSVSGGTWPAVSLRGSNRAIIAKGIDAFVRSNPASGGVQTVDAGPAAALAAALRGVLAAEQQISSLELTGKDAAGIASAWQAAFANLKVANTKAESLLPALNGRSLKSALVGGAGQAGPRGGRDGLLKELAPVVGPDGAPTALAKPAGNDGSRIDMLLAAHKALMNAPGGGGSAAPIESSGNLDVLDAMITGPAGELPFQQRFRMYQLADRRLAEALAQSGAGALTAQALDAQIAADQTSINGLNQSASPANASASRTALAVIELAGIKQRSQIGSSQQATGQTGGIGDRIKSLKSAAKFPLAKFGPGGAEFSPSDLETYRSQFEQFEDELSRLPAGTALSTQEREFVDRTARMLGVLPVGSDFQTCEVSILGGKAPQPGSDSMSSVAPFVAVCPVGGPVGRIVGLSGNGETKLATLRIPGQPLELRFLEAESASSKVATTIAIPSHWNALYLIDRFGGRSVGSRRTWEVEVETDFNGKKSLWLRLEFEKELPERPWYR